VNSDGAWNIKASSVLKWTATTVGVLILVGVLLFGVGYTNRVYQRHQRIADARNEVKVTQIQIARTTQLVEVENQEAAIRVAEANGIAQAQTIINGSLTPLYLQHEAIQAQIQMAQGTNHTVVYIPIGNEGIPLVGTVNASDPSPDIGG
jgi:hypothetical protein